MASTEFDTLAATRELRAAGIEAAHAEALVSTMGRTTGGLLTESRFKAAMAEQTAYLDKRLDKRLAEERTYLDQRLDEQRTHLDQRLDEQRVYLDKRLDEQTAYLDKRLDEQRAYLEQRIDDQRTNLEQRIDLRAVEQTAALAGTKSEIYRYLWLHGSMIVLVLTSLYAMVETWSRGLP